MWRIRLLPSLLCSVLLLCFSASLRAVAISKVLVRNLPDDVGGVRLCEHFSQKGKITQVILRRILDGKNLDYGYVWYRTEKEAWEAVRQFNKSYLGTRWIFCEVMPRAARRARPY